MWTKTKWPRDLSLFASIMVWFHQARLTLTIGLLTHFPVLLLGRIDPGVSHINGYDWQQQQPPPFYNHYIQWLNYSARDGGSLQTRGLKGRSSSPKGREQKWGSQPPTRAFEHSVHSVWLLWHLNSVWRLQHLSMHTTKWPWRTTFYKTSCIEKTNQCKLCSGGSQEKGAGSQ